MVRALPGMGSDGAFLANWYVLEPGEAILPHFGHAGRLIASVGTAPAPRYQRARRKVGGNVCRYHFEHILAPSQRMHTP